MYENSSYTKLFLLSFFLKLADQKVSNHKCTGCHHKTKLISEIIGELQLEVREIYTALAVGLISIYLITSEIQFTPRATEWCSNRDPIQ